MTDQIPLGLVAGAGVSAQDLKKRRQGTRFEDIHKSGSDPSYRVADQERDGVAGEILYASVGMVIFGWLADKHGRKTSMLISVLLMCAGSLMIGLLRWANEIRPCDDLNLPAEGKSAHGFKASELQMARQLIDEMSTDWHPEDYHDEFTAAIRDLIARKVEAGEEAALVSVAATEGSVPREAGTHMVVTARGFHGTIGGGSLAGNSASGTNCWALSTW